MRLFLEKENYKKTGVYIITNLINGKIYIGSTCTGFKIRANSHKSLLKRKVHTSKYLQNAYNKYGKENFIFSILEIVENKKEVCKREQHYLDTLKPYDKNIGYNSVSIAFIVVNKECKEKTKEKISIAQKKRPRESRFTKPIIQLSKNGDFIREWESAILALESFGVKRTNQTIYSCCNGRDTSTFGFIWVKKKDYDSNKNYKLKDSRGKNGTKAVIQLSLDGVFIQEFESLKLAAKTVNSSLSCISGCCRGVTKKAKNYIWKFKKEYLEAQDLINQLNKLDK